jgi:hypothetical protein
MPSDKSQSDTVKAARTFASGSHERIGPGRYAGQQTPESHLKAVAQNVASVTGDPDVLAAAWLHDMVEDTGVTIGQVERRFGKSVASLVAEVTPAARPRRGGRAAHVSLERKRLSGISPDAKTVKLADLIDTLRDVSKADPVAAREFAAEARELAAALEGGDARLLARLARDLERCRDAAAAPDAAARAAPRKPLAVPPAALRAFGRAFTADDIAEPLRSFDGGCEADQARHAMREAGVEVAGVRAGGLVSGYLEASDLGDGPCRSCRREFAPEQVVTADSSLGDVIEVLTTHDWCFVSAFGAPAGVVSRKDVQKPAVRMWLFGIITVVEIEATERVRRKWPGDEWARLVSPARLEKARALLEERLRRKEACGLLDCLQLGDKLEMLMSDPSELAGLGIPTVNAARRLSTQIERLRNSLAHSQAFVDQDWPQVVRLARRIGSVAG